MRQIGQSLPRIKRREPTASTVSRSSHFRPTPPPGSSVNCRYFRAVTTTSRPRRHGRQVAAGLGRGPAVGVGHPGPAGGNGPPGTLGGRALVPETADARQRASLGLETDGDLSRLGPIENGARLARV